MDLPKSAQKYVEGITADIERTRYIVSKNIADESAFILQQTEERYLPDTLNAYYAIPKSSRSIDKINEKDQTADEILVHQLEKIAWATRRAAQKIIKDRAQDLVINDYFISEKFNEEVQNEEYKIIPEREFQYNKKDEIRKIQEEKPTYIDKRLQKVIEEKAIKRQEKALKYLIGTISIGIMVGAFNYSLYVDSSNIQKEKENLYKIAVSQNVKSIGPPDTGENFFGRTTPNNVNKDGEYFIKKMDNGIVVYDKQEHWGANLDGLPTENGDICNNSCWHLEIINGQITGRP